MKCLCVDDNAITAVTAFPLLDELWCGEVIIYSSLEVSHNKLKLMSCRSQAFC